MSQASLSEAASEVSTPQISSPEASSSIAEEFAARTTGPTPREWKEQVPTLTREEVLDFVGEGWSSDEDIEYAQGYSDTDSVYYNEAGEVLFTRSDVEDLGYISTNSDASTVDLSSRLAREFTTPSPQRTLPFFYDRPFPGTGDLSTQEWPDEDVSSLPMVADFQQSDRSPSPLLQEASQEDRKEVRFSVGEGPNYRHSAFSRVREPEEKSQEAQSTYVIQRRQVRRRITPTLLLSREESSARLRHEGGNASGGSLGRSPYLLRSRSHQEVAPLAEGNRNDDLIRRCTRSS